MHLLALQRQTIHSALIIPVNKYLNYAGLTAYQLKMLKNSFAGVHTIIIDEISIVSDRMLTFISRRLSEIYGNVAPFEGFQYYPTVFGDFFQLRPVYALYAFKNRLLWDIFRPIMLRENVSKIVFRSTVC